MFTHHYQLRVRYGDTDQMGYVYYGNYAYYYEQARSEAIRSLGLPYKELEAAGIMMPITQLHCRFIGPAYYDEWLTIVTTIRAMPTRLILFEYEIFNELNKCINTGETQLAFVDASTRKLTHAPDKLLQRLRPFF